MAPSQRAFFVQRNQSPAIRKIAYIKKQENADQQQIIQQKNNNKIKTLKRMVYGFRDDYYFNLRLHALHDIEFT